MAEPLAAAGFASGGGTNLQALLDHQSADPPWRIRLVVSDREGAGALDRAAAAGVPTRVIPTKGRDAAEVAQDTLAALAEHGIDVIFLAGYLKLVPQSVVRAYRRRILNIHPALLPSFPGTHGQKQALDYGVRFSGCTTHFVDEGTDTGPIILQAVVPVLTDDDEGALGSRILKEEHRIFPESLKLWSEGRLSIEGRKVRILPGPVKEA